MSTQSNSTGMRKTRGHSTRRRFTFSEPSAPAELAMVQQAYMTARQNIPNQVSNSVQDREYAAQEERERCVLRKGRSLPSLGRARKQKRMADLFPGSNPPSQDVSTSPKPRQSKTPAPKTLSKPCLADPSTPTRWAGGAFENSPPPSSLPIPVFSDDEGDDDEGNLACGVTSSDGEPDEGPSPTATFPSDLSVASTIPFVKASDKSEPRSAYRANPNQYSPPPLAENQPRPSHTRSKSAVTSKNAPRAPTASAPSPAPASFSSISRHEQYPALLHSPILQHPVPMFPHPVAAEPAFYYPPLSAAVGVAAVPSQPQPSRDLDQLSSELRKMLGISVST